MKLCIEQSKCYCTSNVICDSLLAKKQITKGVSAKDAQLDLAKNKQPVQALAVYLIHIKEQFCTDLVIQRKGIYLDYYKFKL